MGLGIFFFWKLFKLTLTCNGGDGGGSGGSGDGGDSDASDNGGCTASDPTGASSGGYGTNSSDPTQISSISGPMVTSTTVTDNTVADDNSNNNINDLSNEGWGNPLAHTRSINTNIAPPTVTEFDSNMNVESVTTNTISKTFNGGYEITSNRVTTGYLDDDLDSINVTKYSANGQQISSFTGGTIASHLADMGLSGEEAISGEAIGKVVVSALLGVGQTELALSAVSALTQILGVTGVISQNEYDNATMAIGIASAMLGAYHTIQTISEVTSTFGYMNATQKALAIGISALSIKNTIGSFQAINDKYGIEPSEVNTADIANINFGDNNSFLQNYEQTIKYTKERQLSYGTNPSNWQLIDRMAGSYLFDAFLAGSQFFNATIKPTQIMCSVGSQYVIPVFAKQSFLEEDYLASLDDFNQISSVYEQDNNIIFSIKI